MNRQGEQAKELEKKGTKIDLQKSQTLRLCNLLLSIPGVWPKNMNDVENTKDKFFRYIFFIYCISGQVFLILFKLLHILSGKHRIFTAFTDIFQLFRMSANFCKIIIVYTKREKIVELLTIFDDLVAPFYLKRYLRSFKTKTAKISSNALFQIIFSVTGTIILGSTSLVKKFENEIQLDDKSNIPTLFRIWNPFNVKDFPNSEFVMQAISFVAFLPGGIAMFGFTALYLSLSAISIQLLDYLVRVLHALHWNPGAKIRRGPRYERLLDAYQLRVTETLHYVVALHQKIILFVTEMNLLFSSVLLIDVWTILLTLCDTALHFTVFSKTWEEAVPPLEVFCLELSYFFLLCWHSNEIILKSSGVIQSATNHASWWSWNESNKLIARCINLRCSSPLSLTAGPFYKLSLKTFAMFLGIAISYFVFIYQLWRNLQ